MNGDKHKFGKPGERNQSHGRIKNTMSRVSKHIKQESLKNIVLTDLDCEEKLNKIKELLGLPTSEGVERETDDSRNDEETTNESDLRVQSRSRILEGLKGKELKLAQQLLTEIEKSTFLDWNDDSLELSIDGNLVPHSNIRLLTTKLVHESSPQIPLGFVMYIDGLLRLKLPLSYFRDSDAIQTREALLKIKGEIPLTEAVSERQKRQRSESEVEDNLEGEPSKRAKIDERNDAEGRTLDENLDVPDTGEIRRKSPRLEMKKKLNASWKKFKNL